MIKNVVLVRLGQVRVGFVVYLRFDLISLYVRHYFYIHSVLFHQPNGHLVDFISLLIRLYFVVVKIDTISLLIRPYFWPPYNLHFECAFLVSVGH